LSNAAVVLADLGGIFLRVGFHGGPHAADRIRLRMSSVRQAIVRSPSLMPFGYLPDLTPANHAERETGKTARTCGSLTYPSRGSCAGCVCLLVLLDMLHLYGVVEHVWHFIFLPSPIHS